MARIKAEQIAMASSIKEAVDDVTTTSTTDTQVTSATGDNMTVTPAAGTYAVWFSGSAHHSANNEDIFPSIHSAGVQVAASEREMFRGASQGDVHMPFCCTAIVTVDGAQAIEGMWRTTAVTATMHQRQLLVIELATG